MTPYFWYFKYILMQTDLFATRDKIFHVCNLEQTDNKKQQLTIMLFCGVHDVRRFFKSVTLTQGVALHVSYTEDPG